MNPVEEFLAYDQSFGMEKTAQAPLSWAARNPMAANAALTAAVGVATPLAVMAAHEGYQEVKGMIGRARGFKRMMDYNPKLKKLPAAKTKAMFNTLHNAAPDLAKDPVVASSWVNRMSLQDEYVDPRTLADLGSAQQKVGRPGLEFPIASVTSGMMTTVSDPMSKQFDRASKAESAANMLALQQKRFEYDKTQDVVANIRADKTDKRMAAAERREADLFPSRMTEQQARAGKALDQLNLQRRLGARQEAQQEAQHQQQIDFLKTQSRAERARARMYEGRK